MKNRITSIIGLCGLLFVFASCEKDETRAILTVGAAPQVSATATTAVLTSATAANNSVTYSWTPADFGYKAAITYTLQFSKRGTNFASTQNVSVGPALSKTFTVAELNGVFSGVDCASAGIVTPLDVRVKASVGEQASISNVAQLASTPYQAQIAPPHTWAVIGDATPGGWGADTPMTYDYCSKTWKVTVTLTAAQFKFRADNDWGLNYGDDGGDKALEANGANINSPGSGLYDITLNTDSTPKPTYTIARH